MTCAIVRSLLLFLAFSFILMIPGSPGLVGAGPKPSAMANPYGEDVIVYTANQGFLSRIYILDRSGSVLAWFEYDLYHFCDLEVVNNEVYVAEAFAPRAFKLDIATGGLDLVIDDWSLFYFYDLAFDGSWFYVDEWDLNRYDINGTKNGIAGFDESVMGSAWDGTHLWTLDDENHMKCWQTALWPTVLEVPQNNFAPPSPSCRGLWFDGEYFWTAESIEDTLGKIYRFDIHGNVIEEWTEPAFQGWGACLVRAETPTEILVDNADPEFVVLEGTWKSAAYPDAQGGDLRFVPPGIGAKQAAWRVDEILPQAGTYDVHVWKFDHPRSQDMATNARYKVRHRDGSSSWIPIDQSSAGDEWVHLGSFDFDASRPQGILLTDDSDGFVIADAVKLVYSGD